MKPSSRVLDRNLSALLRRAYRPVAPSAEFVERLERALAPWIAPAERERRGNERRTRLRLVGALALAAAAALLLWIVGPWRGTGVLPRSSTLDSLIGAGEVAVRLTPDGPWCALAPERELALAGLESGYAELATPAGREAALRGDEWSASLRPSSRLCVERLDADVLRVTCSSGLARAETLDGAGELVAPATILRRAGHFVDPRGDPWPPRAGSEEVAEVHREPVELPPEVEEDEGVEGQSPPAPRTATLIGRVRFESDESAPLSLEATLLRAVPLPQVADPTTRIFESTDGTFRWDGLEPGRYSLYVHAPGWPVSCTRGLDLLAGVARETLVTLQPGGAITGYVVDRETGAAIADALVLSEGELPLSVIPSAVDELPEAARAHTLTRADGSFELTELSAGVHRLRGGGTRFAPSWTEVVVTAGETTDGVILELGPGGAIIGRVERPDGRPWPGVLVVISRYAGAGELSPMTYASAVTDEEGRYAAEHLASGPYVVLEFGDGVDEAREFEPRYTPTRIVEGRTARVDFLGRGSRLFGVVRDGAGDPVPRANVYLCRGEDAWSKWKGETADQEGRFEIPAIQASEGEGWWLYAGYGDSFVRVEPLTFRPGEEKEVEVVLGRCSLVVEVVDTEGGGPIADAVVMLLDSGDADLEDHRGALVARTWFGGGGEYHLDSLPEGTYDVVVVVEDGGYAPVRRREVLVAAEGEAERLTVALERAGSVLVHVTDAAGVPVSGARVELELLRVALPDEVTETSASTDEEGRVRIDQLLPGRWRVAVRRDGYRERVLEVEVSAELSSDLRAVLERP